MNGLLAQAQPKQAGRKANPQEQAAYKNIVMQVISFISDPEVGAILEQQAQQKGPAQALAYVVMQALQQVGTAAKNAGVDVANHTGQAAMGEILTVLANLMRASGMVDDVQATVDEAMELIMSGGRNPDAQQEAPQEAQEPTQPMGV